MVIACRGLPVLVDILSTPYDESRTLVWMAMDAICSVFELQVCDFTTVNGINVKYFCRVPLPRAIFVGFSQSVVC